MIADDIWSQPEVRKIGSQRMADIDPDSPASCHEPKLDLNEIPPEVPEMVSPGVASYVWEPWPKPPASRTIPPLTIDNSFSARHEAWVKANRSVSFDPTSSSQIKEANRSVSFDPTSSSQIKETEDSAFRTWNLIDDLDSDIPDMEEEELAADDEWCEEIADFDDEVPRQINKGAKPAPPVAAVDNHQLTQLHIIADYLKNISDQNQKILAALQTMENRLIHAHWDPEGAADDMFKRVGVKVRPQSAWEKHGNTHSKDMDRMQAWREADLKAEKKADLKAEKKADLKADSKAGPGATPVAKPQPAFQFKAPQQTTLPMSEVDMQKTTLMEYQRLKQMADEDKEHLLIEHAIIKSHQFYKGTSGEKPKTSRNAQTVSISGFFDEDDPKKESGFAGPGKYA